MIIGIPRESHAGETRVAATPQTVGQLIKLGYSVVVESGAGDASSFSDAAFVEAGAEIGGPWAADVVLKVNAPSDVEIAALKDKATLISLISPALNPELVEKLSARPITVMAMDAGPADIPGAVAGRAVVDGQHRRVPGRGRVRARLRPVLHRAGDRGGQGSAGQGAGRRCRGGRTGRHRRRRQHGRHRPGHRPAARGRRPGQVTRRRVPVRRPGGSRGLGHRLRQGDGRRLQGPRGGAVRRAGERRRHHHHHRADPRQARAPHHHRGDGRLDEVGQRDRGHGRGQRRQRRGHRQGSGDRHRQRRDDHRLHRSGRAAARDGLPALRHQPGEPAQAAHPREGRAAHPGLRRRRAAVGDRRARRRDHLATATGAGVGRTGGRRRSGRAEAGQTADVSRSAGWASRSAPPRCCSCSSRCPRPRCRYT